MPLLSIEDAANNGGNEHFYWLPPMVSAPGWSGTFDAALSPQIEICELAGPDCVLPLLAVFSLTGGPGGETITVDAVDEHYHVNWHTDEFDLDRTVTYRIVARVEGQELGHADVDVVDSGSQLKNVDTDEFIALKNGRTLPIKFRIEDGAVVSDPCAVIAFPDANLEAVVRAVIAKPTGDITSTDVAGVQSLNGQSQGITDLTGIECMVDLVSLTLHFNQIPDLGPVSALTELTYLALGGNTALTDLGPLASNTKLEQLLCSSCSNVTDLGPLAGATNMQKIDLFLVAGVQSLAPLSGMSQLNWLRVHSPPITDLTPLQGATGMVFLDIRSTKPSDLAPLAGMTSLETFMIQVSDVADLSPMAGWSSIKELQLHQNPFITDLSPISGLVTLEVLNVLASNGITDLTPLSGLSNLRELYSGSAAIADLTPIAGLTALQVLDVRGVADITPISGLVNLKRLLIQQAAPDLSPLSTLVNLEDLTATEMNTTDLTPIAGLANLWRLDLQRSFSLTDLTPLTSMGSLSWLRVKEAAISDTTPLAGIALLDFVDIRSNPVACPDATLTALAGSGVTVFTDCF